MTQISKYPIRKEVSDRIFDLFTKILTTTSKKDETEIFITEFFTPTEKIMFSKRIGIMFLLEKGYDYTVIKQILKVSSTTIASINTLRQYRSKGYRKLVAKILNDEEINNFFTDTLTQLLDIPASVNKGSGVWKYLAKEVKKRKTDKPF